MAEEPARRLLRRAGTEPAQAGGDPKMPDLTDLCAPLRRAMLMRAWLAGKSNARLDVDSDLLDALLTVIATPTARARWKNSWRR